jgi:hypothetical protein
LFALENIGRLYKVDKKNAYLSTNINNATNTITSLHLLKGSVDIVEDLAMCDEFVNLEVTVQVVIDQTGEL